MPSTPPWRPRSRLQVVEPHLNGPGGDVPVIMYDVRRGKPEVICGQGAAPAAATIAHYRSRGLDLVPGTGLLAAVRARHVRDLDDAVARLRHDVGSPTCWRPRSAMRRTAIRCSNAPMPRSPPSPNCSATLAHLGRGLSAEQQSARRPATLFSNTTLAATYTRIVKEAESAGGDRVAQIERARKTWSPRLCRRSHRPLLPHPGHHGYQRRAAPRRAHRRRHGALDAAYRSAAHLRLRPLHRAARPARGAKAR